MRTVLISALLLAGAANARAEKTDAATYVIGNLTQMPAGSVGALTLYQDNATFRVGDATVLLDYSSVTNAELGAGVKSAVHDPVYKIWKLGRRTRAYNPPTQYVMVDFKSGDGSPRSMTLEVPEADAAAIVDILKGHRDPDSVTPEIPNTIVKTQERDWWGDNLWKTTRNSETWDPKATDDPPAK